MSSDSSKVLDKVLQPGESFQADTGTMMFTSNNVTLKARFGGFGRMFSGEGLAKLQLINEGSEVGYIGLAPNMPMSVLVPLDMQTTPQLNVKRGAVVAGDEHVRVNVKILPASNAMACLCGGLLPAHPERNLGERRHSLPERGRHAAQEGAQRGREAVD